MNLKLLLQRRSPSTAAQPLWRKRLLYGLHAGMQRIGVPGVVAVGLMVFCAMVWKSAIVNQKDRLAVTEAELQAVEPAGGNEELSARERQEELESYYASLPDRPRLASLVGQMHGHTKTAGVRLVGTDFRPVGSDPDQASRLPALLLSVEIVASHEQMARFVNLVLAAMPNAALEAISMKRNNLTDNVVAAQLRFRLYVRTS